MYTLPRLKPPRLIYSSYARIVHGWMGGASGPHVMDDFGNSVPASNASIRVYLTQST